MRTVIALTRTFSTVTSGNSFALGIRFCNDCQVLVGPAGGGLEGKPHQPRDAVAREDGHLGRRLVRLVHVRPPALARVLALTVLPHNHPV